MKKIALIVGPTACGKTAASIRVAQMLDAEIISADSIQIYRGLDIGSAKPTPDEMCGVPHHMLDVVDYCEGDFSVSKFRQMADKCIADISGRGKVPLVVGGTGLYVNALTFPLSFAGVAADETLRERLREEEENEPGCLYRRLQAIDPQRASQLHPNDQKRIIRAIEIYELSQRPMSEESRDFQNAQEAAPPYDSIILGLTMDRGSLYTRINQRVDQMMEAGLLQEVQRIHAAGMNPALPALQGIGYKQLLAHLNGEYSLEEAVELIKRETRRFAKRQWTWFRRDKRIQWFDVGTYSDLETLYSQMADAIQSSLKGGA